MIVSDAERCQRRAARTGGLFYLLSLITIVSVTYGIVQPVLGGGDPGQIARNVVAHETLFRVGIAGNLLYCVELVVLGAALYVALRPIDPLLALLSALGHLMHGVVWVLVSLDLFAAVRLLTQPEYARGMPAEQLAALARLHLSGFDPYYVALLFWASGSTVGAWLWLRSRQVPRALAAFGILASGWAVACTSILVVDPRFQEIVHLMWFDMPLVLFQAALGAVLVLRGLRRRQGGE